MRGTARRFASFETLFCRRCCYEQAVLCFATGAAANRQCSALGRVDL
jgi:hypothetical protein